MKLVLDEKKLGKIMLKRSGTFFNGLPNNGRFGNVRARLNDLTMIEDLYLAHLLGPLHEQSRWVLGSRPAACSAVWRGPPSGTGSSPWRGKSMILRQHSEGKACTLINNNIIIIIIHLFVSSINNTQKIFNPPSLPPPPS